MLFEKINQNPKRKLRIRSALLLLLFASAVTFTGTVVHLIVLHISSRNERLEKIVKGTLADARCIERITGDIKINIRNIASGVVQKHLDEKTLLEQLCRRMADNHFPYDIGFYFDDSSAELQVSMVRTLVNILQKQHIRVFDSAETYSCWSGITTSDTGDGWKKIQWNIDEQGGVITYQQRIFGFDEQGRKVALGRVAARVRVDDLERAMALQDMGNYGYRVLFDHDGQALWHPLREMVKNAFLFMPYAEKKYSFKQHSMVYSAFHQNRPVTIEGIRNIISGQSSVLRLESVHTTGWMIGMVMLENELTVPDSVVKRCVLNILLTFVLFMLISGLIAVVFSPSPEILAKRMRKYSWFTSVLFIAGVGGIWILQISKGVRSSYVHECITERSQVARFIKTETWKAKDAGEKPRQCIPTGLMISSARISEIPETVELAGLIWQRIPDSLSIENTAGFWFPDEIETRKKEVYRMRDGDATVIGWKFNTRIHQDFRTSIYPFDWLDVNLRMRQREDAVSARLIPDLAAYAIISPTAKPMITSDFTLPGWRIENTYLKFGNDQSLKAVYLGFHHSRLRPEMNDLVLVLSIGRDWVSSFVSVLIPVLAIFSILFSNIYMITNQDETRKQFNFNAMAASSIGSGLALFVVIAIQNVRTRVIPEGILYVEKIYFIIYMAILVNVVVAIFVTEKRGFILSYNNGLIVRYLYWPCYTAILFLVTSLEFY